MNQRNFHRNKKIVPVLIPLIAVMITGLSCVGSMVKSGVTSGIESTAVGGEFMLHSNPKVGDYAVYSRSSKSEAKAMGMVIETKTFNTDRYEITSVTDNEIVVKMTGTPEKVETWVDGKPGRTSSKEDMIKNTGIAVVEYHLDKNGSIKDVLYINEQLGINTRFKKAEPDTAGYIKYSSPAAGLEITTPAGKYKTQYVGYTTDLSSEVKTGLSNTDMKGSSSVISYINPAVKFKKVSSLTVFVTDSKTGSGDYQKVYKTVTTLLSLTTFAVNPSKIMDFGNLIAFAKSNTIQGKDADLTKLLDIPEIDINGMQGTMVESLVEQGNIN